MLTTNRAPRFHSESKVWDYTDSQFLRFTQDGGCFGLGFAEVTRQWLRAISSWCQVSVSPPYPVAELATAPNQPALETGPLFTSLWWEAASQHKYCRLPIYPLISSSKQTWKILNVLEK